ncbi:probable maleylacetoacetate isomerase 2 [Neocloeon triangulifer]|uniref:probable maleylacetoacetate isomerase 2 n=1 Tax=Neocloeon triangulifer TaxID=2078957 RepID=UPI00286F92C8|nr:probable maleylacetoacetate isomerase 2 [Neocloeon triangulifer]
MTGKPTLYSYWRSSATWRVRLALNLKGIEYDVKTLDILKKEGGENLTEEYKAISPRQFVPALVINEETTLIESMAILEYLEESYPQAKLLPSDLITRAKIRGICSLIVSGIQPLQNVGILKSVGEEKKIEWARTWITKGFQAVEKVLESTSGKYCVGDEITLADCCLIPQTFNARGYLVDMTQFPNIVRIDNELKDHPAFKAAHPFSQPDCPDVDRTAEKAFSI